MGLAGAVAVAVWFFLYDLTAATPFRTPALLGAALFEGLRDTAMLTIAPGIVLKYTAVTLPRGLTAAANVPRLVPRPPALSRRGDSIATRRRPASP